MDFLFRNFGKIWIGMAVLGLGLMGFGVWAVYKIVMHITGG